MLIGLTGKKQAGKDTTFRVLREMFGERVKRVAFADKLYASAAAALNVTPQQLNLWKTNPNVRIVITELREDGGRPEILRSLTVRQYLQLYGTEAHRKIFGDDFWVRQLYPEFERHTDEYDEGETILAVTDVRFDNEAIAIEEYGGLVVQVVGPAAVENSDDGHASESGLAPHHVRAALSNRKQDGNFDYLRAQVRSLVADIEEEGVA